MRYQLIDSQLFVRNRQRLIRALPENSYVLLKAGKLITRSRDTEYPFRINSDFFWVTGIEEPGSVLVITSVGEQVLFIPITTEYERLWTGERLSPEVARQISVMDDIRLLPMLGAYKKLLVGKPVEADSIIRPLRMVKDPVEIDLMKHAAAITAQGFASALKATKAGAMEYQVEAELSREFIAARASGHAYDPIVAGGSRACTLHYIDNDQPLSGGNLLLIDAGAEYANYACDVTRVWPVSGTFTTRQRQVYQAVLRVQRAAIERLKPGITIKENEIKTAEHMTNELIELRLLDRNQVFLAQNPGSEKMTETDRIIGKDRPYRQYFPHATSHFLGLDVHDVGDYTKPLEPGMVLTVEPGIYIREEGIGIRLEDDILITEDGNENLTKAIPIEPDEIEARLKTRS